MNVKELFKKRKKEDWAFQWSIIGMVIDWTIALYMLVPVIIFSVIGYKHLLIEPPLLLKSIPLVFGIIVLYLIGIFTNFRSYLQEADQLFLIQRKDVINELLSHAQWHFIRVEFLKGFLLMGLLLPYFLFYMSVLSYVQLSIVFIFWRVLYGLWHFNWLKTKRLIWLRICSFLMFIGLHIKMNMIVEWTIIGLLLAGFLFAFPRIQFHSSLFYPWLKFETKKRNRLLNMVFRQAASHDSVVKETITKENPPSSSFFKESDRIFKNRTQSNVLIETFMKWIVRRPKKIQPLIRVTLLTCSAMVLISTPFKFVVLLLCLFSIKGVINAIVYEFFHNRFLELYQWEEQLMVTKKISRVLLLMASLLPIVIALITFFF